jgi:hypothetical protein
LNLPAVGEPAYVPRKRNSGLPALPGAAPWSPTMPAGFVSISASDEPCFARTLIWTQSFAFRSVYAPTFGIPWLQTSTSLFVPSVKVWFCDWPSMARSAAWLPPSTVICTDVGDVDTTSPRNWKSCPWPPRPADAVAASAEHTIAARLMVRIRRCFMFECLQKERSTLS